MATLKCSQCDRPAFVTVGGHSLCLDHYLKFQQANQIQDDREARYMNFLLGQMEAVGGLGPIFPRHQVSQPIIHQGTMKFQNIKVDSSNVGVLNFGEIGKLDMAMSIINNKGNAELKDAIKEFTDAVIASTETDKKVKNELIEQIAFLSTQAALPEEKRRPSVVKSVLKGIKDTLTSSAALATLVTSWDKLVPIFEKVFGG